MGGHPYYYTVPLEADPQVALDKLREREFRAGRYYPVVRMPRFPVTAGSFAPGARHASIDAAIRAADADGTRSILDLDQIAPEPYDEDADDEPFGKVFPASDDQLMDWFGTTEPDRAMVEGFDSDAMWESLDRGWGVYLTLYKNRTPDALFFAGYSFD
jgi:hypothetical protein